MTRGKWGKPFWIDLVERIGSTLGESLLALIYMDNVLEGPDWNTTLWPIVVLPTAAAFIKGMLANAKSPGSGASLVPPPEGPAV